MTAIGLTFGGTLLVLLILYRLECDLGTTLLAWSCGQLAIGAIAQRLLGKAPWRGLPWRCEVRQLGLAVVTGLGTFAAGWAFVAGVSAIGGIADEVEVFEPLQLLATVVLAPVFEEWLCRGVLWNALLPYSESRGRIAAAAVLFGLLHCLEGLLGFAHRFVYGLAFGWLRERTNSLAPPMLAHATHNAACAALLWWS